MSSTPDTDQEQEQDSAADSGGMGSGLRPLRPGGQYATAYAYLYLTALVLLPVVGVALGAYTGLIDLALTVQASPDLSVAVEWLIQGLVVAFLFWTFVQVVRVTGVGFIKGIITAVARIADNYELPGEPERENSGEDE